MSICVFLRDIWLLFLMIEPREAELPELKPDKPRDDKKSSLDGRKPVTCIKNSFCKPDGILVAFWLNCDWTWIRKIHLSLGLQESADHAESPLIQEALTEYKSALEWNLELWGSVPLSHTTLRWKEKSGKQARKLLRIETLVTCD